MTKLLFVSMIVILSFSCGATVLSDAAKNLQPGGWVELATTNISSAFGSADVGGGTDGNIATYCDIAAWDPGSKQVLYIGGDHNWNVSYTTKFITYSENTNTWQKMTTPPWAIVMHGYHHTAIDQSTGVLFHRPYNNKQVHRYNISSQTWDQPLMPTLAGYVNACDALEFFPELGGLVWINGDNHVYLYKESTNQWTTLAAVTLGGTWQTAAYNPVHKVVVFYSSGAKAFYKLSSAGQVTQLQNPPVSFYDGTGYNGTLTADPVSGKFIVLTASSHDLYAYDVTTDTWQAQSSTNKPDMTNQCVMATPINTYGVTFVAACRSTTVHAYLYKHQAMAGVEKSAALTQEARLMISPNPAADHALIHVPSIFSRGRGSSVKVWDARGRLMADVHNGHLNTTGWPAGIYIARAKTGERTLSADFLVQH
jgi:hypothetical protein